MTWSSAQADADAISSVSCQLPKAFSWQSIADSVDGVLRTCQKQVMSW